MKRSQINPLLAQSIAFFDSMNFRLPAWACWKPEDWKGKSGICPEIMDNNTKQRYMQFFLLGILVALWGCSPSPAHSVSDENESSTAKPFIPSRQIHLDFHTSEYISAIGVDFDKKQFQEALKLAHVNSINVFAKCWHGWSYYNSETGPRHPHLDFDLLKEQIDACHEIKIQACIYFAVGHAETDGHRHPEWRLIDKNGKVKSRGFQENAKPDDPLPEGTWTYLAPVDGYLDHMLKQIEEISKNYDVDGFWFDGVYTYPVAYNAEILREMEQKGFNPKDDEAVFRYSTYKWNNFMERASEIIGKYHSNASIFFNGTTQLESEMRNVEFKNYRHNTQYELEDLPTTSWGWYDKFPLRSKLFHNDNKPLVAMSGKFHSGWGEFGGFKHPDAIKYEAASMIAFGAACNFGDQLHPNGKMDMATYQNIGQAYEYVEKIEDYGINGKPYAKLGLWYTNNVSGDEGVCNMLLESQIDFEVVDPEKNFDKYQTIIIPSSAKLNDLQAKKFKRYIDNGGGLIVFCEGALNEGQTKFIIPVGADYIGKASTDVTYMAVHKELSEGVVQSPVLCNTTTIRSKPQKGTKVLADVYEPYFSRTYKRFSSHRNTPPKPAPEAYPSIIKNGRVIFIVHNLDQLYYTEGARIHRDVFINALKILYTDPVLKVEMPSAARVSLLHQADKSRYVAHLLFATPIKRGNVHVIEDLVPLYEIPMSIKVKEEIRNVYMIPDKKQLSFKMQNGRCSVIVPKMQMHVAIIFDYSESQ